jgi:aspartate carbamoyltransferase catalytic subunit
MGVTLFSDLEEGVQGADVVIVLRLQKERISSPVLPSAHEYSKFYCLTEERLQNCKAGVIVLHPGPMNRGVEISSGVADSINSVILQQVTFGIAVRMAVMDILNEESKRHG